MNIDQSDEELAAKLSDRAGHKLRIDGTGHADDSIFVGAEALP